MELVFRRFFEFDLVYSVFDVVKNGLGIVLVMDLLVCFDLSFGCDFVFFFEDVCGFLMYYNFVC